MPPKLSLSEKLKADEKERAVQAAKAVEVAARRAADLKKYEKNMKDEEEARLRALWDKEERDAILAEERRIAEIKRKTKPHFSLNQFGRKLPTQGETLYFGDWIGSPFGDAWIPHGEGEHSDQGR